MKGIAEVRGNRKPLVAGACLLASVGAACLAIGQPSVAQTTQESANKTSAAISRGDLAFATEGQTVEILAERVKTSKPTDLLLSVTAESSILTDVRTIGDDDQTAKGQLKVFITIDGKVVPPTIPTSTAGNPPHGDTAAVVFANQRYQRQTTLGEDDRADTVKTYLETRHANGFNWMAFNVGSGIHDIKVYATYSQADTTAGGNAVGIIGSRSLVVEPTKAAVGETIALN